MDDLKKDTFTVEKFVKPTKDDCDRAIRDLEKRFKKDMEWLEKAIKEDREWLKKALKEDTMNEKYEELKIVGFNNNEYWFHDCYGLTECKDEINNHFEQKVETKGILVIKEKSGYHACNKSAVWDDVEGYVDTLQNENDLPDNQLYIVTYYRYDGSGLEQLIDYSITKQQIIDNVNNQKYVEGADYFTMEQLKQLEEIEALAGENLER